MALNLVVLTPGPLLGQVIPLNVPQLLIGRGPECAIRPSSPTISRRHCALLFRSGRAFVRDLGSKGGTLVNGARVKGTRELVSGDRLDVGPLAFEVRLSADQPLGQPWMPESPPEGPVEPTAETEVAAAGPAAGDSYFEPATDPSGLALPSAPTVPEQEAAAAADTGLIPLLPLDPPAEPQPEPARAATPAAPRGKAPAPPPPKGKAPAAAASMWADIDPRSVNPQPAQSPPPAAAPPRQTLEAPLAASDTQLAAAALLKKLAHPKKSRHVPPPPAGS
jgi:predicted component of type VI protein secretion system